MAIKANRRLALLLRWQRSQQPYLSNKRLAKNLGITEGYLAHLLRGGRPVHISEPLALKLLAVLKIHDVSLSDFWGLIQDQNKRTSRYYKRFSAARDVSG